jgi:hypothetical protein
MLMHKTGSCLTELRQLSLSPRLSIFAVHLEQRRKKMKGAQGVREKKDRRVPTRGVRVNLMISYDNF